MPTEYNRITATGEDVDTRDSRERARAIFDRRTGSRRGEDEGGDTAAADAAVRTLHGDQPSAASAISAAMGRTDEAQEGATLTALAVMANRRGGTADAADALASAAEIGAGVSAVARAASHAATAVATGIPEDAPNFAPVDETSGEYSWMEVTPPSPRELSRALASRRHIVRRPTMGIVQYSNRYATIEVVVRDGTDTGQHIELFNSSYRSARHEVNTNFIIQQVHEELVESATIVQTLGDWYLSDSGELPRMFKVSGALIEAQNFPWVQEFRKNFDKYLRARQCILRSAQVHLTIDDMMYTGYVMGASMARDANVAWPYVPFTLTMVLRRVDDLRAVNVFPDVPNPEDFDLIDPKTGDLFREGIRVATLQPPSRPADGTELANLDVQTLSAFAPYIGAGEFYTNPTSSSAQLGEIVHGSFEGDTRTVKDLTVEYKGEIGPAELRIDVNALVALARRMNSLTGRTTFNIQRVRNGYMAGRQADFEGMGITNPDVLTKYGFPTEYQQEVSARRRRQQEEYRGAIEDGIELARDAVENLRAEVRWL